MSTSDDFAHAPEPVDKLRAGSLCTGIGGLDLAVEAHLGAELVWCAEWEDAPSTIIEREWPGVPNLRDLTAVDWQDVEPVDVLSAGYPCQPFSHAGKRKGQADERHLWPYIAEAVRVLRPRWVVLENVAGHLTLGFGDVLRDLAEAGFDAEWCVLRASDVGAPHQRARLFIVARNADRAREDALSPTGASRDRAGEPSGVASDAEAERRAEGRRPGAMQGQQVDERPPIEPCGRRHALPAYTDQAGPQGPQPAGRRHLPAGSGGPAAADTRGGRLQERLQRDGRQDGPRLEAPRRHHPDGLGAVAWGDYQPAIWRWGLALGRPAPRPTDDAGRLSPEFVEWMMGYPAGWVDGLTRTQALKALGNAVVPQQGLAALRELACGQPAEVAA